MTRPAKIDQLLIAAGASRNNASDCRTSDGLVAFAAGHLIALWNSADKTSHGVHRTLSGHQGDVSALNFAHDGKGTGLKTSRVFVSGDAKGVVRVWKETEGQWSTLAVLTGHTGSVSSIEALELPSDDGERDLIVLSGGSDSLLQVWKVSLAGAVELVQKFDLKGKIPLELALSYLPSSSDLVLAVGATETRIQLYASSSASQPDFRKSLSLEGHSDWVRCLTFTTPLPSFAPSTSLAPSNYDVSPGEVLLASGSQDNYIRLWRFSRVTTSSASAASVTPSTSEPKAGFDAELDELEKKLADSSPVGGGEEELRVKAHDFVVGEETFSCASEAVLLGHDAWVTGLNFAPLSRPFSASPSSSPRSPPPPLQLLSTSADRSLILWTPMATGIALDSSAAPAASTSYSKTSSAHSSFVWTSTRRFGEFASPTNLGFFGALWGRNGRSVLASGWGGSWHVWRRAEMGMEGEDGEEGMEEWEPQVAISGHFGQVKQLMWEPEKGEYLLSCCGGDMSTRLWAPWRRQGRETWHELARPQIHGYPLTSLTFTARQNRLQFVSGADEKIVRVFDAPGIFLQSLQKLCGIDFGEAEKRKERPMAANVPPLGLSNRAIATADDAANLAPASNDPFDAVAPVDFNVASHPPLEEQLLGSTLWPETEKLYGHSFELVAVSSAHSAPLIATACKATLPDHAVIRLYNTDTWRPVGHVLTGHSLTITKLAFSPASSEEEAEDQDIRDRWLLSVGRDRTWRMYERVGDAALGFYRPIADAPKAHSRIIWDACWAADSSFFATASRDKTVKLWTRSPPAATTSSWSCSSTLKFAEAATSVAATTVLMPQGEKQHVLAVGLENGEVRLFTSAVGNEQEAQWDERAVLDSSIAHVLTVSTLSFCPPARQLAPGVARLATGSEDRSVRIFDLQL
ncbi:hypothetical protein JCM11251_003017 [Rhodosporidiobolus azoricus]